MRKSWHGQAPREEKRTQGTHLGDNKHMLLLQKNRIQNAPRSIKKLGRPSVGEDVEQALGIHTGTLLWKAAWHGPLKATTPVTL